ncbi:putative flavoprotein involved in K+ transport [Jannaschia faecimaris]|uniref:Putative flavoprotein involved in K+ transport n=1 Tax=Jannaschia faecimaris TaxID=1244108 RepID=A0A1H3U953_9RHOB|nr:NAD(P)-binding domain-containing protein [Jannaschia faecimaris]SDZ58335.1 putative flavoprotein involved in K+ transport [Jannaschia faecimaris]
MKHICTVIVGAGQAGLAMSRCLSDQSVPHVVLERGEIANSWKTERWDSLRLLTPNWQSRLPGQRYTGPDPYGYMTMPELIGYLETYASSNRAPVEERVRVTSVKADAGGYRVATNRGDWTCDNIVVASGACNVATVPACASELPEHVTQLTPLDYRHPAQLVPGGVLIVGGSATGVQLASEIRLAGHDVVLSTGEHIRVPRHYRGRDLQWWMEESGLQATPITEVDDIERVRRVPSLQLTGRGDKRFTDLNDLQDQGVEIVGRMVGLRNGVAAFSGSLGNVCAMSDLKMNRLLRTFDAWAEGATGLRVGLPERFEATRVPSAARLSLDLASGRFSTVIWATGFRPDHSWIQLPIFDRKGRLVHEGGTVAPGLYVLGLPFMRRRDSAALDGVGSDARFLADHIVQHRGRHAALAAVAAQ